MSNDTHFVADFDKQVSPYKGVSLIIFGASGDLAKKKLLPSLYSLYSLQLLPKPIHIICYGRTKFTTETYREELCKTKKYNKEFLDIVHYVSGKYAACPEIKNILSVVPNQSPNRIFYLSLPPGEFRNISKALKESSLITKNSGGTEFAHTKIGQQAYTRIVLEKPFGESYTSAVKLNRFIISIFDTSQVYSIDHYLGKEPIQNILFFRFANSIFENSWNSRYIDHIQLSLNERIQVENRAGYFDSSGMLKDMIQSHALQMLALALMEPPKDFLAKSVRSEKHKVLSSLRTYANADEVIKNVVRAQYEGYLQETGIVENSKTETFVALKTYVDNWRWSGMPIYIRSGKALQEKCTELVVYFKKVPHNIFQNVIDNEQVHLDANRLVFRIQPETFIRLHVQTKIPGNTLKIVSTDLNFPYEDAFKNIDYSNGYDRILFSAMINDASLFLSSDELFSQWQFADSILDVWKKSRRKIPLHTYGIDSKGPNESLELIAKDGRQWNS